MIIIIITEKIVFFTLQNWSNLDVFQLIYLILNWKCDKGDDFELQWLFKTLSEVYKKG